MEKGQLCQLDVRGCCNSPVASQLQVTGVIVAAQRHVEDASLILYFLRVTSLTLTGKKAVEAAVVGASGPSSSIALPQQTSSLSQVSRPATATTTATAARTLRLRHQHIPNSVGLSSGRNDLVISGQTITSSDGYVYTLDGWYTSDLLNPVAEEAERSGVVDDGSGAAVRGAGIEASECMMMMDEWAAMVSRDSGPCELRYLCYTCRPWFSSPFTGLLYLTLPERNVCYSAHICHRCLSPFFSLEQLTVHLGGGYCLHRSVPGTLIYHDAGRGGGGGRRVYHVDGAEHLHYCRCLSLLGKCFIESKLLENDVDIYEFFVVTMPRRSLPYGPASNAFESVEQFTKCAAEYDTEGWDGDVVVAYFSRLKHHAEHTLSCIVSLPMFQHMRLGFFMLDVAYYLTRERQRQCGCAAMCGVAGSGGSISRPFSPQGQALLLTYWRRALMRAVWVRENERPVSHFSSLKDIIAAMGIPMSTEDCEFALLHWGFAFYSSAADANRCVVAAASGDAAEEASSTVAQKRMTVSLVFDKDALAIQMSADAERRRKAQGVFNAKYMKRDPHGDLVYCWKLFHY